MRTTSPSRSRRVSGRERKANIIAAAASLFARKGFAGTTTREIARSVGVSETLVFKHFPTKRTLYAAILAEKSPIPQLLPLVEEAARKRDDRRVFALIALRSVSGHDVSTKLKSRPEDRRRTRSNRR